ncbi:MAG: PaaI family thioesterase, partial [Mycobacterium sp.]
FHPFPTAAMHIDFVRGITVDETHLCRGVVVRAGRRITVADTMIESPEGTLLARGTCTFSLDLSQSRVAGFSALG